MEISQITPANVKNFVEGNYNYYISRPSHIEEQANYRAYLCQSCHNEGRCPHCGCRTPQMFYSPSKVDSQGRWGRMLPPDEWDSFKITSEQYKEFEKSKFSLHVKNDKDDRHVPGLLEAAPASDSGLSGYVQEGPVFKDNVGPDSPAAS